MTVESQCPFNTFEEEEEEEGEGGGEKTRGWCIRGSRGAGEERKKKGCKKANQEKEPGRPLKRKGDGKCQPLAADGAPLFQT